MRVVLDTNVWLDWLVFDDPRVQPLKRAHGEGRIEIVINAACADELLRVLCYDMGKWTLTEEQRARCERSLATLCTFAEPAAGGAILPLCADPDDQKFLELAAVARADALITRDLELLRLAHRTPGFRIVKPSDVG